MGCNFGTKTNPIVIDDEEKSKKSDPIIISESKKSKKSAKKRNVVEISDSDEDAEARIEKENLKKKKFNEKLFNKSVEILSEMAEKRDKRKQKTEIDDKFQAELKKMKVYYFLYQKGYPFLFP